MTTYNGSQYIEGLLNSLRLQTCPVQEVIIADDGSTDNTVNIVQNYIKNII
ncbi:glycosyltransferase [Lactobacillus delbrueckii]|uniref:glycosyltransferase n=1 Tax=Lactobacillus delbrueckii TaxID=1584 RepID=UPI0009B7AB53